jgi:murein hydrolase activator
MQNRAIMTAMKGKFAILFFLCLVSGLGYAGKTQDLNKINKVISNLQKDLSVNVNKHVALQQQLKKNEEARGVLAISRKKTEKLLKQQQILYDQLQAKQRNYQKQLNEQQNNLFQQMRATYMLGKQSYVKVLLNQDDLARLNRTFVYYKYLQSFRWQLINELNRIIQNINKNQKVICKQEKRLLSAKQKQNREADKLKSLQNNRIIILKTTDLKIKTQKQKLNELLAQKKELERIIVKLKSSSASVKFTPSKAPWRRTAWPTQGVVRYLFGSPVAHSQLKWDGVLIDAPEGQKVYAISSGRVIFSQWLQGYGLLLIIDHGHGYMSLYGRNNSLYKKVGDVINKGDLVAEVGNSGGYEQPSLYFAIRYNGVPVDPKIWCRS